MKKIASGGKDGQMRENERSHTLEKLFVGKEKGQREEGIKIIHIHRCWVMQIIFNDLGQIKLISNRGSAREF